MAFAIVRLMQESGVQGPSGRIEYQREKDALAWAAGKAGHPWDFVTVEVYEDEEAAEAMGDADHSLQIDLATEIATYV